MILEGDARAVIDGDRVFLHQALVKPASQCGETFAYWRIDLGERLEKGSQLH